MTPEQVRAEMARINAMISKDAAHQHELIERTALPSDLPPASERVLPRCLFCLADPVQVFGREMVDLDRDGIVYACAGHRMRVDTPPAWTRCGAAFCPAPAVQGVRQEAPGTNLGISWVIYGCAEHPIVEAAIIPWELR